MARTSAQGIGFAEAPNALENAPWNNRLLIVCVEAVDDADITMVEQQYDTVDWAGYLERDLILVWLTPEDAMSWTPVPNPVKEATILIGGHYPEKTGLAKRTECGVETGHVTLIGKDGTIKRVWSEVVSNEDLFAVIDAMPMRRREMAR